MARLFELAIYRVRQNHSSLKLWRYVQQVDVKSFDFVKLCINICVVSEILLRVQRDMAPRAVIDSPKNLTGFEVRKLTANSQRVNSSKLTNFRPIPCCYFFLCCISTSCVLYWIYMILYANLKVLYSFGQNTLSYLRMSLRILHFSKGSLILKLLADISTVVTR